VSGKQITDHTHRSQITDNSDQCECGKAKTLILIYPITQESDEEIGRKL